jgi:antitoxin MazE
MKATIISIGNSKGIRLPKPLLEESGLINEVELKVKKGEIRLVATRPVKNTNTASLSESALAKDWNKPEEDEAWASLQ